MKMSELKEVIDIIEQSKIDVLKLEKGDFKLYYQKQDVQNIQITDNNKEVQTKNAEQPALQPDQSVSKEMENIHQITSPMLGTYYSRPNPDAEPFVHIGAKVSKNDTVCILEAMKLLNEVASEVDGEIIDILVEEGQIIEFGQPLFTIKVSE